MANISETKTPKAGEWWVRNREGRIFYICGFDPEGCPVHWNEDVGFYTSKMRFFCQDFYHEPRCTGFGWVETPAETFRTIDVNPGEGYRWLEDDEIVTPTDEVFRPDLSPCWVKPLTRAGYTVTYRCSDDYPVRRSIARTQPVEPAIDPNDMPRHPVPGKVVATGTVTFTPVTPITCVACGVNWALDGRVSCRECYEHAIEATGCPVESPDNMAAIIAEHTQQVRELTQRIGELARQVNKRDRVIEQIRTALHQDFSV